MSDVTDSRINARESREQFSNAEKLAAVGRLAAGVAHEIRNPLNSVRAVAVRHRKGDRSRPTWSTLQMIADEIERLERIVRHFLEFSRPPLLKLRRGLSARAVEQNAGALCLRAEEQRVRLCYEKSGDLPPAMATTSNSNKSCSTCWETPWTRRPRVARSASLPPWKTPPPRGTCSWFASPIRGRIAGRHPRTDFRALLHHQARRHRSGALYLRQIVAGHGGRLAVESSSPAGTTFALWIPAVAADPLASPPA